MSEAPVLRAPARDYTFPGLSDRRISTILAGLGGAALVFSLAVVSGWVVCLRTRGAEQKSEGPGPNRDCSRKA